MESREPVNSPYHAILPITDEEFVRFQRLIYEVAGISLSPAKKMMVATRLQKRLASHGFYRYRDYYDLVTSGQHPEEMQVMVDRLTTNETYFFREPDHFDRLRSLVQSELLERPLRVWSAACSSGDEVYSLAMLLNQTLGPTGWELTGSDVSYRVLKQAQRGHYPLYRNGGVTPDLLAKYCLKGVGKQAGTFLINRELREKISFKPINLKNSLPHMGRFNVIFLRNVLIYFDQKTKAEIVHRVVQPLKPGGYLFISHTESLHDMASEMKMVKPSIFIKK